MKRYYDLTHEEKLALSGEAIHDAIKLEAVHRGIKPPLTLDSLINQYGFQGFTAPADSVVFYEICTPKQYGGVERSGLAYRTEAEARRALGGAIGLMEDGYGAEKKQKFVEGEFTYSAVFLTLNKPKTFASRLESYCQDEDDSKFNELSELIRTELNGLWQDRYNKEVLSKKRAEYLRLAQGNEEIAISFWSKTEHGGWPLE